MDWNRDEWNGAEWGEVGLCAAECRGMEWEMEGGRGGKRGDAV